MCTISFPVTNFLELSDASPSTGYFEAFLDGSIFNKIMFCLGQQQVNAVQNKFCVAMYQHARQHKTTLLWNNTESYDSWVQVIFFTYPMTHH